MANKTWNTNRTGGGTYEFSQDAQGNYKLNSVGFKKLNKLNLPGLEKSMPTTILPVDPKEKSDQTQKAFGDVQPFYYKGGGADEQYIDEYKIKKDKSLGTESEPAGAWDRGQWGPGPKSTVTKGPMGDEMWTSKSIPKEDDNKSWEKVADSYTLAGQKDNDELNKVYKNMSAADAALLPGQSQESVGTPITSSNRQPGFEIANKRVSPPTTFRTETQKYKERYKPTEIKAAPKKQTLPQTVLKNVTTSLKPLANAIGLVMNPIMGVGRMIAGAISPEQRQLNERNSSALSSLGYKTRGELGSNRDPERIAGNPAHNVFAGMNAQSMTGNVFNGARKRVATRTKTAERNKNKWSQEKKERFDKKTQEFKDQIQEAQGKKINKI